MKPGLKFVRLSEIALAEVAHHMSDPRTAVHMPLLTSAWDEAQTVNFIAMKEACWARDGLGHWAFLADGKYVGWGGFQKEQDEWDFGLVLRPDAFGLGPRIAKQAIDFAIADERIPFVTFLLPPSRKNLGALCRLGTKKLGQVLYDGATFTKFRLDTP